MARYWATVLPLALAAWGLSAPAHGTARDLTAERQGMLDALLTRFGPDIIDRNRALCASGQQPSAIARKRALGAISLPDAADYCITILIRLGRDGRLTAIRDTSTAQIRPAVAFDTGFVSGYRTGGALPAGLPSMASLRSVAARCFAQAETNANLCSSAGLVVGLRASAGELVRIR